MDYIPALYQTWFLKKKKKRRKKKRKFFFSFYRKRKKEKKKKVELKRRKILKIWILPVSLEISPALTAKIVTRIGYRDKKFNAVSLGMKYHWG